MYTVYAIKSYTARFPGEWKLIYQESATTRREAMSREKQLKSYQGRKFVKQLIGNYILGDNPE